MQSPDGHMQISELRSREQLVSHYLTVIQKAQTQVSQKALDGFGISKLDDCIDMDSLFSRLTTLLEEVIVLQAQAVHLQNVDSNFPRSSAGRTLLKHTSNVDIVRRPEKPKNGQSQSTGTQLAYVRKRKPRKARVHNSSTDSFASSEQLSGHDQHNFSQSLSARLPLQVTAAGIGKVHASSKDQTSSKAKSSIYQSFSKASKAKTQASRKKNKNGRSAGLFGMFRRAFSVGETVAMMDCCSASSSEYESSTTSSENSNKNGGVSMGPGPKSKEGKLNEQRDRLFKKEEKEPIVKDSEEVTESDFNALINDWIES